jgi:hypothetical protein
MQSPLKKKREAAHVFSGGSLLKNQAIAGVAAAAFLIFVLPVMTCKIMLQQCITIVEIFFAGWTGILRSRVTLGLAAIHSYLSSLLLLPWSSEANIGSGGGKLQWQWTFVRSCCHR